MLLIFLGWSKQRQWEGSSFGSTTSALERRLQWRYTYSRVYLSFFFSLTVIFPQDILHGDVINGAYAHKLEQPSGKFSPSFKALQKTLAGKQGLKSPGTFSFLFLVFFQLTNIHFSLLKPHCHRVHAHHAAGMAFWHSFAWGVCEHPLLGQWAEDDTIYDSKRWPHPSRKRHLLCPPCLRISSSWRGWERISHHFWGMERAY